MKLHRQLTQHQHHVVKTPPPDPGNERENNAARGACGPTLQDRRSTVGDRIRPVSGLLRYPQRYGDTDPRGRALEHAEVATNSFSALYVTNGLRRAFEESANHVAAVGIWLTWLRNGDVVAWEWCPRLDVEVPQRIREDADAVAVIAIAPHRLARPIIGRAVVIGEFLEAKGFRVEVVHVRARLRAGAPWTALRGGAVGIVPPPRISTRAARPPFSGTALISRSAAGACMMVAALLFTAPAPAMPPTGQPGLIATPHPGGQAGVTAPPRALAPAAPAAPAASVDDRPSITVVPVEPLSYPQAAQLISATPPPPAPRASAHSASPSSGAGATALGPDIAADPDVVRVGSVELTRPEWMPALIADRERDWNAFLTDRVATAADQAGLTDPAIDAALGSAGGEQAPLPQEVVLAQVAAADPQALVPAITNEVDALISDVAAEVPDLSAPVADVLGALLPQ